MTANTTTRRPLRRGHLLVLLAFEAGVVSLAEACAALNMTSRELIDTESDLVADGQQLALEMEAV